MTKTESKIINSLLYTACKDGIGTANIRYYNKNEVHAAYKLATTESLWASLHFYQPINSSMLVMVYTAPCKTEEVEKMINKAHQDWCKEHDIKLNKTFVVLDAWKGRKRLKEKGRW